MMLDSYFTSKVTGVHVGFLVIYTADINASRLSKEYYTGRTVSIVPVPLYRLFNI